MSLDTTMLPQMSLGLSVDDGFQFENFFTSEHTEHLVHTLKQLVDQGSDEFIYISGGTGCGKTHLLLATYHYAQSLQLNCGYLPLEEFTQYSPTEALIMYADTRLLLIDGLELIAGDDEWQLALFDLYNNRKDRGLLTVFSAELAAHELAGIQLNDLKTRLAACLSFHIPALNDDELASFLMFSARSRGMILNEQCVQFIVLRAGRTMSSLIHIIEQLDYAQLSARKRITIPFIKELFSW